MKDFQDIFTFVGSLALAAGVSLFCSVYAWSQSLWSVGEGGRRATCAPKRQKYPLTDVQFESPCLVNSSFDKCGGNQKKHWYVWSSRNRLTYHFKWFSANLFVAIVLWAFIRFGILSVAHVHFALDYGNYNLQFWCLLTTPPNKYTTTTTIAKVNYGQVQLQALCLASWRKKG